MYEGDNHDVADGVVTHSQLVHHTRSDANEQIRGLYLARSGTGALPYQVVRLRASELHDWTLRVPLVEQMKKAI
jgi:hypothetical protein